MRTLLLIPLFAVLAFAQYDVVFPFEANLGDFPTNVRFVRRLDSGFLYVTRDTIVLRNGVRIQIANVDPNTSPQGESPTTTKFNFYQGRNPLGWRPNRAVFDTVRWATVYPGVGAGFTVGARDLTGRLSDTLGTLTLTVQPGADLTRFRLRVLNTGVTPFFGPGGVWFSGGRVPGVFTVSVQASQLSGQARIPITANFKIESPDTLSIDAARPDPALTTEVQIQFPSGGLLRRELPERAADGNRYAITTVDQPADFGEDGKVGSCVSSACADAIVANVDDAGRTVWVTVFGGSRYDSFTFAAAVTGSVVAGGTTASDDLPLTGNPPQSRPGADWDVFLALLDRATGQLRTATYGGIEGSAGITSAAVDSGGDVAAGGSYEASSAPLRLGGYLFRWHPATNRFAFSSRVGAPVLGLVFDASSRLAFASADPAPGSTITAGLVDAAGVRQGSLVTIPPPTGQIDFRVSDIRLQPLPDGDVWLAYQLWPEGASFRYMLSRISFQRGQEVASRQVASGTALGGIRLTPAGNLKMLVRGAPPTETTTADAPLAAGCLETSYFAIFSPAGQLLHATYVVDAPLEGKGFDFENRNEPTGPPTAALSCFANSAGRTPLLAAAPGQLITLTGGGFGPPAARFYSPGNDGKFPVTGDGFRVRIDNTDVPIIATARGLIAVQVPFDLDFQTLDHTIEAFENDRPLGRLPLRSAPYAFGLFNTGDRNNSRNLPALAALNEDGSVNSAGNPARAGSVVSLFGSGAGFLNPLLSTGGLSPIPPDGALSLSPLLAACRGCVIQYLGSAPGLSTSVVQMSVQLAESDSFPPAPPGVHPHAIAIGVGTSPRDLFVSSIPDGVVWVR